MQRRILITGAAGFVGYHLTAHLLEDPDNRLVLVDNFSRGRLDADMEAQSKHPNIQFINGDLTNPALYDQLGDGYDEVYHLAAVIGVSNVVNHPARVVRVNSLSTVYMLEWFIQGNNRKILFSSTSEVYGWTQQFYQLPVPTPEQVPLALTALNHPRASYAGTKILGELAFNLYCTQYKKPYTIVRYHNVYGPRMGYEHVIPELYMRIAAGENPLVVYSADHARAFCYVSDAIDATVKSMRMDAADGQTINIGNSLEEIKIGDLAQRVIRWSGRDVQADLSKVNPNDPIKRRCPDISKARQLLNYTPQVTLDEGIAKTLTWYAQHPAPARS